MPNKEIKAIKIISKSGSEEFVDVNLLPSSGSKGITNLISPNGTAYVLNVKDDGELFTIDPSTIPSASPEATEKTTTLDNAKLFINSVYCGGDTADENSLNYCSHNFVELANASNTDINLENYSLQYGSDDGQSWKILNLSGVIKKGSTFLIRGAQCSNLKSPITKIKVNTYDLEWYNEGELKKFSTDKCKFYLCHTTEIAPANPYTAINDKTATGGAKGYIDFVSFKITGCAEKNTVPYIGNKYLFKKYYTLDPGKKALKAIDKRNNANDWTFINLSKMDNEEVRNIEIYTPKASFENKDFYYDKTMLDLSKPSIVTCSFGIQATDGGADKRATRCFNWVTSNLDERYIWIRTEGETSWGTPNQCYLEDDVTVFEVYRRQIKNYSNNTTLVANKFIKRGLSKGVYEYIVGAKNNDGTPMIERCSKIYKFTVRSNEDVATSGIKFIQTSDQQGFNWDEYQVWRATCANITKEENLSDPIQFMINTGDMTQDGNRINEWKDYFDAKGDYISNMEEMSTIGNNDLSLKQLNMEIYNNPGDDNDKLWLENILFFYTFEIDERNKPLYTIEETDYWVNSLYSFNYGNVHFMCMNSEIKDVAETDKRSYGFSSNGNFYIEDKIINWCEKDLELNSGYNWTIAYCHEMPYTIFTTGVTKNTTSAPESDYRGASMNYNVKDGISYPNIKYWFGEFCQKNNIPLVLGGHKHTQATSWPLLENVKYDGGTRITNHLKPFIVLDKVSDYDINATKLVEYNDSYYPDTWFLSEEVDGEITYSLKPEYQNKVNMSDFRLAYDAEKYETCKNYMVDNSVTPVVYAMSQSSGYKHTSNKELPSKDTPWLRYSHPTAEGETASKPSQKFPFYTIWEIGNNEIKGHVRKVYGIFNNAGKFAINTEWQYVKNGLVATTTADGLGIITTDNHSEPIRSLNGLDINVDLNSTTAIISIKK